jgi:hypothetical protein
MSDVSQAPAKATRQALCLQCGSLRTAKAQYLGRGSRTLRCNNCGQGTTHAAVNWDGEDLREEANRKQAQGDAEKLRELEALLAMFRTCSIDVLVAEDEDPSPDADPLGGLVEVVRWLEPEGYLVRVQRGLSMADRVYCLDWAWKSMRPTVARWHRCPVEIDPDGELFQRIHNNAKELGIFSAS